MNKRKHKRNLYRRFMPTGFGLLARKTRSGLIAFSPSASISKVLASHAFLKSAPVKDGLAGSWTKKGKA